MHAAFFKEFDLSSKRIEVPTENGGPKLRTELAIVHRGTGRTISVLTPVLADDVDSTVAAEVLQHFKDSDYARIIGRNQGKTPIDLHPEYELLFGELTHTFMRKCMGGHMSLMHQMIYELMVGPTWTLMCKAAVSKLKEQGAHSERNVAACIRDAWAGVLEVATTINSRLHLQDLKKLSAAGWSIEYLENMSLREMQEFEFSVSMARKLVAVIPWEDWKTLAWSLKK